MDASLDDRLAPQTSFSKKHTLAHAADAENKGEATVDTSKNPITGTVTTTKKMNKKVKGANGEATAKVTEKTKVHKNGKVEKSESVDASATQEAPEHK